MAKRLFSRPLLSRRAVLAAGLLWPVAGRAAGEQVAFRVLREGRDIGSYVVGLTRSGEALEVSIAVDIAVTLGPITLYRHTLRGSESWRGGRLMAAESETVSGGRARWMRARREAGVLWVEGYKTPRYAAPEGSVVASHWNRAEIGAPMIDLEDGSLLSYVVTPKGETVIEARGRRVRATRFSLSGPGEMDIWFDQSDMLAALRMTAEDGSEITYKPV